MKPLSFRNLSQFYARNFYKGPSPRCWSSCCISMAFSELNPKKMDVPMFNDNVLLIRNHPKSCQNSHVGRHIEDNGQRLAPTSASVKSPSSPFGIPLYNCSSPHNLITEVPRSYRQWNPFLLAACWSCNFQSLQKSDYWLRQLDYHLITRLMVRSVFALFLSDVRILHQKHWR